jgi:2-haloacid dehalogenase
MPTSTENPRTIKAIVFDAYGTLYDVQSVAGVTDAAFPGHGTLITQIWRLKQLEYTWLRSMMGAYEDFWRVTQDSLAYALGVLGLSAEASLFGRIAETYNTLAPYPDAALALAGLGQYRLSILSNGSAGMLRALVDHSGLGGYFDDVISVDAKRVFKPDPRAYALVEERLGVAPSEVLFVSSNGFDVAGAKNFGFTVARVARVTPAALRDESAAGAVGPAALFKALRSQVEIIGREADIVVSSLAELVEAVAALG